MITVGCDPELAVMDLETNTIVSPYRTDPPLHVGHVRDGGRLLGSVGIDGGGLEFRPQHSSKPSEVARNFGEIIAYYRKTKYLPKNLVICAGSFVRGQLCLGGHLHLGGISEDLMVNVPPNPSPLTPKQVMLHSSYCSDPQRKLMLGISYLWQLEDFRSTWGRRKGNGSFGSLYGFRSGRSSRSTLEIRSPSSDWTAHPHLFALTLEFAKILAGKVNKLDSGAIDPLEDLCIELVNSEGNNRSTYFRRVREFLTDGGVKESLLAALASWPKELSKRRNTYGLVPLRDEEWQFK